MKYFKAFTILVSYVFHHYPILLYQYFIPSLINMECYMNFYIFKIFFVEEAVVDEDDTLYYDDINDEELNKVCCWD